MLAMGRAHPGKGLDDLLDALTQLAGRNFQLPHLVLAAVTDGEPTEYQERLQLRLAVLPLPATLPTRFDPGMPGLLSHPRLRAVIVPSRIEPFGRILWKPSRQVPGQS